MNDQQLRELAYRNLWPFYACLTGASPHSRLQDIGGMQVSVTPVTPDRSILNAVVYDDPKALAENLDTLKSTYERAGVTAWTVWVHPDDRESPALLEAAGHRLDAAPAAMAIELEGWQPPEISGFEIERSEDIAAVCALNDHAYGYTEPTFGRAITQMPEDVIIYAINDAGGMRSCVVTHDSDGDCAIYMVATHGDARGRGFAGALMAQALIDAAERGCRTSSLQSTKLGYPVYRRLGYKDLGSIEMWEHRV